MTKGSVQSGPVQFGSVQFSSIRIDTAWAHRNEGQGEVCDPEEEMEMFFPPQKRARKGKKHTIARVMKMCGIKREKKRKTKRCCFCGCMHFKS